MAQRILGGTSMNQLEPVSIPRLSDRGVRAGSFTNLKALSDLGLWIQLSFHLRKVLRPRLVDELAGGLVSEENR